MNHQQEAKIARDNGLTNFLSENALIFTADKALQALVLKINTDYDTTTAAAAAAAADNKGYSAKKVSCKEEVCLFASQLCARSQVKLDLLGDLVISKALNSSFSYFNSSPDALSASRLQNVHDTMKTNLLIITVDYLTAADLTTLQTKIDTYTAMSGTTTDVNSTSPAQTKALEDAIKVGADNVFNLKKLATKYSTSNPTFFSNLNKACRIPPVAVRHTTVNITVSNATTKELVPNVRGTLSKTIELGIGSPEGLIIYQNVPAGDGIATYTHEGYLTGTQKLKIKRGVINTFVYSLVPGTMTTEAEQDIASTVKSFIVAQEARKKSKAAKAKAIKIAKAAIF